MTVLVFSRGMFFLRVTIVQNTEKFDKCVICEYRPVSTTTDVLWFSLQESWLLPTERASAVKTMNGQSCGEKIMTIRSAVLIQYQRVTDRRTDGQNLDS